jgi:hypothetical protein
MPKLSDWQTYATNRKGEIVVWINQTDALKGTDSDGVCNAITRDWITSFDSIRARAQFYQKFRRVDASGQFLAYSLPDDYVRRQKQLEAENKVRQVCLTWLRKTAAAYGKKHAGDNSWSERVFEIEPRLIGGPNCQDVIPIDTRKAIIDHLDLMKGASYAGILHLLKDSGGHAVAVEYLPGKEGTKEDYVYQFLDPNTGWFAFGDYKGLREFIWYEVLKYYPAPKYNRFKMYNYRME